MLDVLATVYLVWALAEGTRTRRRPTAAAIAAVAHRSPLSPARGIYSCFVQFPDRPHRSPIDLQHDDWRDAMAWARTTDPGSGWLADPHHAAPTDRACAPPATGTSCSIG